MPGDRAAELNTHALVLPPPPPTPFLLWIVACGQSGLVGSIPASLAALQIVRDIPNSAEDAFVFYTLLADTPEVW